MWQRALRRWLWRGNVVLACAVASLAAWALQDHEPDLSAAQNVPTLGLDDGFRFQAAVTRAEVDAHIGVVRRFHGQDRPAPVGVPSVATEPRLSAYRVVLYIHDPDGRHALTLRCKDPAHDRVYRLRVGETDGSAFLLAARFGPKRGYFDVVRGDESFTFDVPIRLVGGNRSIIALNEGRAAPTVSDHVRAREALPPMPVKALKFVPFRGAEGGAGGVRVTGVKPGSWLAEMGVKPGDVILAWDGANVRTAVDMHRCAESSRLPRSLKILRGVASNSAQEQVLKRS